MDRIGGGIDWSNSDQNSASVGCGFVGGVCPEVCLCWLGSRGICHCSPPGFAWCAVLLEEVRLESAWCPASRLRRKSLVPCCWCWPLAGVHECCWLRPTAGLYRRIVDGETAGEGKIGPNRKSKFYGFIAFLGRKKCKLGIFGGKFLMK